MFHISLTHSLSLSLSLNITPLPNVLQRFVPSEYGNEVDRVFGLPPFQAIFDNKKKIRRATEAAGIPYTFVSANSFAAYFIDFFLHPREQRDEVIVYGSGEAKGT